MCLYDTWAEAIHLSDVPGQINFVRSFKVNRAPHLHAELVLYGLYIRLQGGLDLQLRILSFEVSKVEILGRWLPIDFQFLWRRRSWLFVRARLLDKVFQFLIGQESVDRERTQLVQQLAILNSIDWLQFIERFGEEYLIVRPALHKFETRITDISRRQRAAHMFGFLQTLRPLKNLDFICGAIERIQVRGHMLFTLISLEYIVIEPLVGGRLPHGVLLLKMRRLHQLLFIWRGIVWRFEI